MRLQIFATASALLAYAVSVMPMYGCMPSAGYGSDPFVAPMEFSSYAEEQMFYRKLYKFHHPNGPPRSNIQVDKSRRSPNMPEDRSRAATDL